MWDFDACVRHAIPSKGRCELELFSTLPLFVSFIVFMLIEDKQIARSKSRPYLAQFLFRNVGVVKLANLRLQARIGIEKNYPRIFLPCANDFKDLSKIIVSIIKRLCQCIDGDSAIKCSDRAHISKMPDHRVWDFKGPSIDFNLLPFCWSVEQDLKDVFDRVLPGQLKQNSPLHEIAIVT